MDIAYKNQEQVKDKEEYDEIYNNKKFKLIVQLYNDFMSLMLRFLIVDLVSTYVISFNVFDYLIFNHLKDQLTITYPYRLLYGILILFIGVFFIGFITITFKSLYKMQNPMIFIKGFFYNYYNLAQSQNLQKKDK